MSYRHVFGPVISSRLNRSLGLDLLARQGTQATDAGNDAKVCSFDCLYCEVGPNPQRTLTRNCFAPPADVYAELEDWLAQHDGPLDHVTLGGSGEPCLHSELGAIIHGVRSRVPGTPVAVLTNSSLLPDPALRKELAEADAVLPSLDTLVPDEFQRLNRPHPDLDIHTIADALLRFRQEFTGRLYLEVLLCQGVNDSQENLELLTDYVPLLQAERVDVVTLSRPGAYAKGRAVDQQTLARFRDVLEPLAVAETSSAHAKRPGAVLLRAGTRNPENEARLAEEVYQSCRRRPQTAPQLAQALAAELDAVEAAVGLLEREHRLMALHAASQAEPVFYRAL